MKQVWKTFGSILMSITVAILVFTTSLKANAFGAASVVISGAAGAASVNNTAEDKKKELEWATNKEKRDMLVDNSKISNARVINDTIAMLTDNLLCTPNVVAPNLFIDMFNSVPIPCKPKSVVE